MTTTGFIGLGVMGRPMAANLVRAGYGVVGYSRRAEPIPEFARQAGAAREHRCGHRRVRCPDHHAAGFARRRGGGARRAGRSRARSARSAADRHEHHPAAEHDGHRRGGTGGRGAYTRRAGLWWRGRRDQRDARGRWSVEQRRTLPWRCPSWGRWARSWLTSAVAAGQLVKAADQLLVGGIIELLSEALLLLEASDVDIQAAVAGLGGGLAGSRVLELKAAGMLGRQFTPGFRIDLHHKDLGIVLAAAREVGIALPVTGLVSQLFTAARAQGLGSLDHTGLLKVLQSLSTAAVS